MLSNFEYVAIKILATIAVGLSVFLSGYVIFKL